MIAKSSHLCGRTLISHETGGKLGRIKDVGFNFSENRVAGFCCGMMGGGNEYWLPLGAVSAIGPDAVIIKQGVFQVGQSMDRFPTLNHLQNRPIMTEDGRRCSGRVEGVTFDTETGQIRGYEVSEGMFSRLFKYNFSYIPAEQLSVRDECIFIQPAAFERMHRRTPKARRHEKEREVFGSYGETHVG
jgi:uncharacterized protein YrrD